MEKKDTKEKDPFDGITQSSTVELSREEWEQMFRDSVLLKHLMNGGVDNWDWFGEAAESAENELKAYGFRT